MDIRQCCPDLRRSHPGTFTAARSTTYLRRHAERAKFSATCLVHRSGRSREPTRSHLLQARMRASWAKSWASQRSGTSRGTTPPPASGIRIGKSLRRPPQEWFLHWLPLTSQLESSSRFAPLTTTYTLWAFKRFSRGSKRRICPPLPGRRGYEIAHRRQPSGADASFQSQSLPAAMVDTTRSAQATQNQAASTAAEFILGRFVKEFWPHPDGRFRPHPAWRLCLLCHVQPA
jgi:hypothetical protein